MKIKITFPQGEFLATLKDTPTGLSIYNALPFSSTVSTWGKELYFAIPVFQELENDAKEEVDEGTLAYWPTGQCFCVFWGQTPASAGTKPKAASAVNVFGAIEGDLSLLDSIGEAEKITIDKLD